LLQTVPSQVSMRATPLATSVPTAVHASAERHEIPFSKFVEPAVSPVGMTFHIVDAVVVGAADASGANTVISNAARVRAKEAFRPEVRVLTDVLMAHHLQSPESGGRCVVGRTDDRSRLDSGTS
jgi:hypothetical protein